jgi:hypothetical protein
MGAGFIGSDAQLESFRSQAPVVRARSVRCAWRFFLAPLAPQDPLHRHDRTLQWKQRVNVKYDVARAFDSALRNTRVKERFLLDGCQTRYLALSRKVFAPSARVRAIDSVVSVVALGHDSPGAAE